MFAIRPVGREGADYAQSIFPNCDDYKYNSPSVCLAKVNEALFVILNLAF